MCKILDSIYKLPVNFIVNAHESLTDGGEFEIVGKGQSARLWSVPFADKHRFYADKKSFIPRIKAAIGTGIVTGRPDLLDAEGFLKPGSESMFDDIAIRR